MIIRRASGRVSCSLLCLYVCFLLCAFSGDFLRFCCLSSLFLVYYIFCDVIEVAVVPESLRLGPQDAQQKSTPSPCEQATTVPSAIPDQRKTSTVRYRVRHNHLDGGKKRIGRLFLDFF